MPRDKSAIHGKVLAAAREEFLEYGFEKASMRRIGEKCGMTAAGLYRHCRDKADLFDLLVGPAVQRMYDWMEKHVSGYMEAVQEGGKMVWRDSEIDMMREVVYPRMDEYRLLLTCAQGTKYENFVHDLTETGQEKMLSCMSLLRQRGCPVREISSRELHLLLSAYTTALFEPVIHGYSDREAFGCLETIETFFLPGWKKLMGFEAE